MRNVKVGDIALAVVVAVAVGVGVGLAVGLAARHFGWSTGFVGPLTGGIVSTLTIVIKAGPSSQTEVNPDRCEPESRAGAAMRYKSKQALLDDIRTELKRWLKGTAGADTSGARPNKRLQPPKAHAATAQQRATRPRLRG